MGCIATIGFVFADGFANVFVCMNTLGVIIAITHIAGYIATRRGKNRRLVAYKRKVIRSAIRIADNKRMAYIGGWLLTSFVWGLYVSWFLLPFWFFSLYPLLAIWIWYYKVVQNTKRLQNKIIGFKPLSKMMFVGTLQCVGICIFVLIFDMDSLSLYHPIRCADNKELQKEEKRFIRNM